MKANGERTFSAPGRVEIGGNHTDHQHGRVLACAVNLEAKCKARANGTSLVHIADERYGSETVDLSDLQVREDEKGTSAALIRGVAAWFKEKGYAYGGFDATITSDIPAGSGLSSSAAFEVLIGNVFKGLFGAAASPLDIALAGQFAENVYFGKPCGLMDQAASSFGGLVMIDFANPNEPIVRNIPLSLSDYMLCVVDTKGSHADLTDEYAAVPLEMKKIANHFGKEYLREVEPDIFYADIANLRQYGDRAVLRGMHFFGENDRVLKQAKALEQGEIDDFLKLVIESGLSSFSRLQNIYPAGSIKEQEMNLALSLSQEILFGKGAWRVHGGGFAGTILAFVPISLKEVYQKRMSAVFGNDCCHFLSVRAEGGIELR
ncbi:MAG: galactokinase [Lachnospiraceae bacterium]|nr:galactokinase [Lachnospiraceae bacterium]